jgi:hypothetical protein
MNKRLWSTDPNEILVFINTIIAGGLPVLLQMAEERSIRTKIAGIHFHHKIAYLLLAKPTGMSNARNIRGVMCKVVGLPVMAFSCSIASDGEKVMASMLPRSVYSLDCRAFPRLKPKDGSMATFFIKGGSRVSICMMADISMGGVRLVGKPTRSVQKNDVIGPCTLSLAGRDALISRELTVNKATVVRLEEDGDGAGQLGLGLKFDLNEREKLQLKEHVDFVSGVPAENSFDVS